MKKSLCPAFVVCIALCLTNLVRASSATWEEDPVTNDWNSPFNWTPETVPSFSSDTATFDLSNTTHVFVTNAITNTEVASIVFTANAASNPFTITRNPGATLYISGAGIVNNSGVNQSFVTATDSSGDSGFIGFINSATAGTNTVFTNQGASIDQTNLAKFVGETFFSDTSTAGSATIYNDAGTVSGAPGGTTRFVSSSTAGNATIQNGGASISGAGEGRTQLGDTATAGSATIINEAGQASGTKGGLTQFGFSSSADAATAGNATITNNGAAVSAQGGQTFFDFLTTAGNATINNNAATATGGSGGVTTFGESGNPFDDSSPTAGHATITNFGSSASGTFDAQTVFYANSSADHATINNNGANGASAAAGETSFNDTSVGGSATITNGAGTVSNAPGGSTIFNGNSSAKSATINNQGGGVGHAGFTFFNGSSDAGSATINNNGGALFQAAGGFTSFSDSTSAASAAINNNASTGSSAQAGFTQFLATSNAGEATITNKGAFGSGPNAGQTDFYNGSSADLATIVSNGGIGLLSDGATTTFHDTSSAGAATLIANGGTRRGIFPGNGFGGEILFKDNSTGGTSRVEVFGNGIVDISAHTAPGVTIGSVEGSGNVFLGSNNLSVGSRNIDTTFSGVIHDGAPGGGGGTGGSLTKIGTGTLTLSGTNAYTGATNINAGVLQVDGSITSNTSVNSGGTLAGTGTVTGSVTNNGGTVSPGDAPGTLTVNSFNQMNNGTLLIQIAGAIAGQFSVLNVLGAASLTGTLDPVLLNGFIPTIGEKFVFLDYASHSGAFSNIANQIFDNGMEEWQVVYENNDAYLTIESASGTSVPEKGSSLLLTTVGLLGLITCQRLRRSNTRVSDELSHVKAESQKIRRRSNATSTFASGPI